MSTYRSADSDILRLCAEAGTSEASSSRLIALCAQVRNENALPFHVAVLETTARMCAANVASTLAAAWNSLQLPLLAVAACVIGAFLACACGRQLAAVAPWSRAINSYDVPWDADFSRTPRIVVMPSFNTDDTDLPKLKHL